jgi:hypothetical protein
MRRGNKNAAEGEYEQSGHGLNMARNAEGIKEGNASFFGLPLKYQGIPKHEHH